MGWKKYIGSWEGHVAVRLRSGFASFEDKKRCRMVEEDRCVLCNGGKVEDVKHFVLECEEFDRCRLLHGKIKGTVGAEEWVKGYEEGQLSEFTAREKSGCE